MGWTTKGHTAAKRFIGAVLNNNRMCHAYLITGPQGVGRTTLGTDIAKLVNCAKVHETAECNAEQGPCGDCSQCARINKRLHADVRVIGLAPHTRDISMETVKDLIRAATLKPFEGIKKVFIIERAEKLNDQSSNALLKSLEEPGQHVVWVLVAPSSVNLLKTIVSRCHQIQLAPFTPEAIEELIGEHNKDRLFDEEQLDLIRNTARGKPGRVYRAFEDPSWLEHIAQATSRAEGLTNSDVAGRFQVADVLAKQWHRDRESVTLELTLWAEHWSRALQKATDQSVVRMAFNNWDAAMRAIGALEANASPRLALDVLSLRTGTAR